MNKQAYEQGKAIGLLIKRAQQPPPAAQPAGVNNKNILQRAGNKLTSWGNKYESMKPTLRRVGRVGDFMLRANPMFGPGYTLAKAIGPRRLIEPALASNPATAAPYTAYKGVKAIGPKRLLNWALASNPVTAVPYTAYKGTIAAGKGISKGINVARNLNNRVENFLNQKVVRPITDARNRIYNSTIGAGKNMFRRARHNINVFSDSLHPYYDERGVLQPAPIIIKTLNSQPINGIAKAVDHFSPVVTRAINYAANRSVPNTWDSTPKVETPVGNSWEEMYYNNKLKQRIK